VGAVGVGEGGRAVLRRKKKRKGAKQNRRNEDRKNWSTTVKKYCEIVERVREKNDTHPSQSIPQSISGGKPLDDEGDSDGCRSVNIDMGRVTSPAQ